MTNKIHSIFPIRQDPACLLKWGWSTVYFNSGTSASCHRTQKYAIDPNNFDLFHNLPDKIVAREKMLNNQWPGHGCEYCKNLEEAGSESDRMSNLKIVTDPGLVPPELHNNSSAVHVTPTMLEVYFNNTCNMKCVYCGPHFSSAWEEENRKFNHSFKDIHNDLYSVKTKQHNPHYDQMVADLWKYLDTNQRYRALRRFHILGGEPFLLSETEQCINFWHDHPNPDLTIGIVTNLNIPHDRFLKYVDRFRTLINTGKIMTVQIIASIDMWGSEQEYVRHGLNSALLEENFESIVYDPIITCGVNSALTALTIKKFPELLEKINHWNSVRELKAIDDHNRYIIHSFNYDTGVYNPFYFSKVVFEDDFKKILNLMPADSQIQVNQKQAMEGIANAHLNSSNNLERIAAIKESLDILDCRRNTNWRATFPWLDKDFSV